MNYTNTEKLKINPVILALLCACVKPKPTPWSCSVLTSSAKSLSYMGHVPATHHLRNTDSHTWVSEPKQWTEKGVWGHFTSRFKHFWLTQTKKTNKICHVAIFNQVQEVNLDKFVRDKRKNWVSVSDIFPLGIKWWCYTFFL